MERRTLNWIGVAVGLLVMTFVFMIVAHKFQMVVIILLPSLYLVSTAFILLLFLLGEFGLFALGGKNTLIHEVFSTLFSSSD